MLDRSQAFVLSATFLSLPSLGRSLTLRTESHEDCLTVRGTETQAGEYSTLAQAAGALGQTSDPACIFINPGEYPGQTVINYGGPLTIYGYTNDSTSWNDNTVSLVNSISSEEAGDLDASSTLQILGSNVKIYNLNISNTYGEGAQAVALTANGQNISFYGCSISGYQDTFYAKKGNQYITQSIITGAVDYIFGDANLWVESCTMASNGNGAITATSRMYSNDTAWYVFNSSDVCAANGYNVTGEVYLGRPWRALSRVQYQYCILSDVVAPAGWTTLAAGATPLFYEIDNTGPGSGTNQRQYESVSPGIQSRSDLFGDDYCTWIDCDF